MSPTVSLPRAGAPVSAAADFTGLGVPAPLVRSLTERGITAPFPIQTLTLPDSLAGRDVLGRGRTGSGKTLAFCLPLVARLAADQSPRTPRAPRGLVLVPTRELAAQVADTLVPLATALRLRVAVIHGGVSAAPQIKALTSADIVVACPGRLEDLVSQRHCRLDHVRLTVLDEADHMADLGFLPGVKRLLDRTPERGQRVLFSATLDNGVDVLVRRYLHDPVTHSADAADEPAPEMRHHVLHVAVGDKAAVVHALAAGASRRLLFTRTKHGAKKLAQQLTRAGVTSVELHGNLSQNARTRNLEMFSTGEARVLVATDIAARGIHVDEVELVVHVDPPAEHKAFLHRSGRTARAGATGTVVTVVTPDQRRDVADLVRRAGIRPEIASVEPGHGLIETLAGPAMAPSAAPRGAPQAAVAPRPVPAGRPAPRQAASPGARHPGSASRELGTAASPSARRRRRPRPARG